jgi:parallel beta-helix repeat protein
LARVPSTDHQNSYQRSITVKTTTLASITALALLTGVAAAGPLNPPTGPVTSSYKTLTEVEPRIAINTTNTPGDATSLFKIAGPGSYYLTDNIAGIAGKTAITITNPTQLGVDIDLNGFKIHAGQTGIACSLNQDSVHVHNGSIDGAAVNAIDLSNVRHARVDGLTIYGVGGAGVTTGDGTTVRDCRVSVTGNGIVVGNNCIVKDCTVDEAVTDGVNAGTGCLISNCTAQVCTNDGFHLTGNNNTLSHCEANQCGSHGIETAASNVVEACTVGYAQGAGILLGLHCTIRDTLANNCTYQGIVVQSACTVTNNQCKYNGSGSAGIWIAGSNCQVEGNVAVGNGYGLYVDGAANLIVRNRASLSGNMNYYVGAGNFVGPIVVPGTNATLISGALGATPSTLGSTDPNANFSN